MTPERRPPHPVPSVERRCPTRFAAALRCALAGIAAAVLAPPAHSDADAYRDYLSGTNFSALAQITPDNVDRLAPAWTYSTGFMDTADPATRANTTFQAKPLIVAGNLVFCTPLNRIVALDPATGEERWVFDPGLDMEKPQPFQYKCRGALAEWRDPDASADTLCAIRLLFQTLDHRLFAIDAASGARCTGFGDDGELQVFRDGEEERLEQIFLTTTPIVARDVLVLGSAMTDNVYIRNPRGVVRAFDPRSGARLWEFDPVPRTADHPAMSSWDPEHAPFNGGANVWTIMAADERHGLVYLPTSSPTIDHYGAQRPGANLYANSVVALDVRTGELVWHAQLVHHDVWDYDLPSQPLLTDLRIDGVTVPVLVQNTKMGLVFVFDRRTGEPVYPIEERPVPQRLGRQVVVPDVVMHE
ncbi:MAG: PQQ-binding-like beta-propeller repeat protein, partial [Pseudomonadota bacterium]